MLLIVYLQPDKQVSPHVLIILFSLQVEMFFNQSVEILLTLTATLKESDHERLPLGKDDF